MTADIRLLRWHERDREDYQRLTAAIDGVRRVAARGRGEIVVSLPTGPEDPDDVERACTLLAQRRARDAAAGPLAELFGEPGWDILLTLYIAFEEGRTMRPADIADAVVVRPAVLARWITVLRARGLLWSEAGHEDAPAAAVSLTQEGMALALRCVSGA